MLARWRLKRLFLFRVEHNLDYPFMKWFLNGVQSTKNSLMGCYCFYVLKRDCFLLRIALKTMGKGEYFKLPSQASCVQNIQNEGRKTPFSFLIYHLRPVAYNSNRVLLRLEFDLRKCHSMLDQGFVYLLMKWWRS